MWYEKSYRRHLCDMHIEDWNSVFLSEFSPKVYYENLKKAKIQNAMIYFQSHVGYCYFPTKAGHMHKAFIGREDAMKRLVELCREGGISVTGYYSLIYNNWAHDKYPQWRMLEQDGTSRRSKALSSERAFSSSRYGLCCPNNSEYREFVFGQMEEINNFFDFDGMFFDMLFWPHMCYCESCKTRWKKEVGGEIPTEENWEEKMWLLHISKRREWMGEFAQTVTDKMKCLHPGISVEHNVAFAVLPSGTSGLAEEVLSASDYAGGDLYGGILAQSFTCKFYRNITKNQPFEYMFSRCKPNLSSHTITKSDAEMASSVFLTCAHHGATLVIDAIDPIGTMDGRVYEKIGKIFEHQSQYEPYMQGEMVEDIGIYYSLRSKFTLDGNSYSNHSCAVQAVKTMIENNISVGVTGGWHDLSAYKAVIASCLTCEDEYDNDRLVEYVRDGGVLYFSGRGNKALIKALIGASVERVTDENVVYIAPSSNAQGIFEYFNEKYPLPFGGRIPVVTGVAEGDVLAYVTLPYTNPNDNKFASIHSNPPGISTNIPAIIKKSFGKGTVMWSAAPIEHLEIGEYKKILLNLIFAALDKEMLTIRSNAPKQVELVTFKNGQDFLVGTVLLNESCNPQTVNGFEIKIRYNALPKKIILLPKSEKIDFNYDGRYICFQTKPLTVFDMYKVVF